MPELFHRDPMGTCWARFEGRIEIQFEPLILGEGIMRDFEDVDFVVAFKVNDALGVFIEEVVCYYETTVIAAQHDVRTLRQPDKKSVIPFNGCSRIQKAK